MRFHGSPLAVLRVGKKRGGALFTSEDLDLLQTIANQAALALAHAYSYAELELRRRQQAAAWRGEREALVETVAAEIAHEVRYPINYFRSIFQRGQGDLRLDAEDVDIGCDEVERLERLVSPLRRVSSMRLERQRITVDELVVKAERLLRDQFGARALEVEIDATAAIRCDSDQVTQVLVNLLANALDAAGDEGRVGVAWEAGAADRAEAACSRCGTPAPASRATPRASSRPGTPPSPGARASASRSPTASCARTVGPSSPSGATGGRSSFSRSPPRTSSRQRTKGDRPLPPATEGWR